MSSSRHSNSSLDCPTYCGFRTLHEVTPLVVSADHIAPFSLPQEALSYEPPPDKLIATFKNGDKERKIYSNTELANEELELLKELQEAAAQSEVAFYPSLIILATRYLSRTRGDPKKALKLMEETQKWREEYFCEGPITDTTLQDDFRHGIIYFVGRDQDLRPTIVVRANRVPAAWYKEKQVDKIIRMLIFCLEYMLRYMVVPGRVEGNCVIVDLKGLSAGNVPVSALQQVYSVMSHHYMGRVYKFYICNLSMMLGAVAGVCKSMLTDRQRQKLVFVTNTSELQKDFALHQLEVDLGGSRPLLTTYYPFQLEPGPFDAGYSGGPRKNAVSGVHEALAPSAFVGRIWDPARSPTDNKRLAWSPQASEILEKCGMKKPSNGENGSVPSVSTADPEATVESVMEETPTPQAPPAAQGDYDSDEEEVREEFPMETGKLTEHPQMSSTFWCDLFAMCKRKT